MPENPYETYERYGEDPSDRERVVVHVCAFCGERICECETYYDFGKVGAVCEGCVERCQEVA